LHDLRRIQLGIASALYEKNSSAFPSFTSMPWLMGLKSISSVKRGAFTAVFQPATPPPANDGSFHSKILGELLMEISLTLLAEIDILSLISTRLKRKEKWQ
jgi:hypothetical protein